MSWIFDAEIWIGLLTLTALEIVLGIDNIVFLSILAGKLPSEQQARARRLGLVLAMLMRIALLTTIAFIARLTQPLLEVFGQQFSGRDLILIGGGLFLIAKSTSEIHEKLEGEPGHVSARVPARFGAVITQIVLLDIVFSLDSVITAVGLARDLWVMITAVVVAVAVMIVAAGPISTFVERRPTVKMLALSFLLLIGLSLFVDGFGQHINKGYIYFAMAFSVFVEILNLRVRGHQGRPVELHEPFTAN
jgi:predicted tellurium resistance membrane protein TerC